MCLFLFVYRSSYTEQVDTEEKSNGSATIVQIVNSNNVLDMAQNNESVSTAMAEPIHDQMPHMRRVQIKKCVKVYMMLVE